MSTLCDPMDCSMPGLPVRYQLLELAQTHAMISFAAAAKSLQSCPTVRPHRRQPTRLPCPWDSPGKNTGVGCHFLLQCMKVKSESEAAVLCPTLCDPMDCSPAGSSAHGIFQARVLEWAPSPSPISFAAAAAAKLLQSCPTLCDPIDGSPPGSPVPGILQARVLEWGAIAFSYKLCYHSSNSLKQHAAL